mmetsp:Transcript_3937/g.8462  ORF Transcript_3937/g.8462 Transcript_3937/m.8462 type:complete len:129 (-) Transcript_3937:592-978(-)|eukprot:CAMPEP_0168266958 /NCGR_PEP_ID=MMETSP0141_2-20121125/12825_1 /TAXON_ID=44445 /ORGANISM="Pseudo-nitzschia australis, Strain 10249 10 AB" /LENGTH=128 /DNA_ID=CAMNT_0008207079 /DNA_START=296 /DNA_END=682 /DNA_ORIENTATION=-
MIKPASDRNIEATVRLTNNKVVVTGSSLGFGSRFEKSFKSPKISRRQARIKNGYPPRTEMVVKNRQTVAPLSKVEKLLRTSPIEFPPNVRKPKAMIKQLIIVVNTKPPNDTRKKEFKIALSDPVSVSA